MKKHVSLILALAIIVLVCLIAAVGCSDKNDEVPTSPPKETITNEPADEPTEAPTDEPTEAPTDEPTEAPTSEPTEAPTSEPTEAPTDEPTEAPTDEPTEAPTGEPTEAPTDEPTEAPTGEPTETPTDEPTEAPTDEPTETPSETPSEQTECELNGHTWDDATCTTPKTCSVCGAVEGEALGHDKESHEALAPTCTEAGHEAYVTCKREGCTYTTYEEIEALGHKDDDNDHNCDTCGAVLSECADEDRNHKCDTCGAQMGEHVPAAEDTHTCSYCSQPASEHTGGSATCTEKAVCTICGEGYGDVLGHNMVLDTTKGVDGYTWTEDHSGCVAHGKCDRTDCVYTTDLNATVTPSKKQTQSCIDAEIYDYTATFTEDWAETQAVADVQTQPATGHSYGNTSYAWNSGKTAFIATRSCSVCAEDMEGHTQTATSTNHTTYAITTQPTCTEAGVANYYVTFNADWIDGDQTVSESYPELGHDLSYSFDMNNHWQVCSRCDAEGDATAHAFGDNSTCICGLTKGHDALHYNYDLKLGVYYVSGFYPSEDETDIDVVIANYYDNGMDGFHPVTYIYSYAIGGNSTNRVKIKSLVIPEGITRIEGSAFLSCTNLTSVSLPESLEYLGARAFENVPWIDDQIEAHPDGDVYIGNILYTYKGTMPANYTLNIKEGTRLIAGYAYKNKSNLKAISMPDSLVFIGYEAFCYCTGLQEIVIGENVKIIDGYAFQYCSGIQTVTFNSKLEEIGRSAFSFCNGIESLTLPSSVKIIGDGAFSDMDTLTSVVIEGSGLTYIDSSFNYCEALVSVTFSISLDRLKEISEDVWYKNCPALTVYYDGGSFNSHYDKVDPTCTEDGHVEYWYNFIDGQNYSGKYFYSDEVIDDITIPAAHTGGSATCTQQAVCTACGEGYGDVLGHDPDTSAWIGGYESGHYHTCKREGCDSKVDVTAHTYVEGVCNVCNTKNTFCTEGLQIYFDSSENAYYLDGYSGDASHICIPYFYDDGVHGELPVTFITSNLFSQNTTIESVSIPDSIYLIADYVFSGCTNLATIDIPSSVYQIGCDAFWGTAWLESQPNGVVYAGNVAIGYKGDMPAETSLTLNDGTVGIALDAFWCLDNIKSVYIPSSVIFINGGAFYGCSNIESIVYGGTLEQLVNATPNGQKWYAGCGNALTVSCEGDETSFDFYHPAKEATCTESGNVEYWFNFRTGKAYDSEFLSYEIADAIIPAGCVDDNSDHLCDRCGETVSDHEGGSATCTEKAVCSICGESYGTAPGHNFENDVCTRCGVDKPYTRTGNKITFGEYPQTEVTDSSLTAVLNGLAGDLPSSSDAKDWTSYGYYIWGSVENYMWYIDVTSGGERYRGVYFTSYRPKNCDITSELDNTYQDENGYSTETVYWFKFEPISWTVLSESDGSALILCDMIIDSQQYDFDGQYTSVYANCTIRAWLNDTFYNTAFSELQQSIILTTSVDNSTGSTSYGSNPYACDNTDDKVFFLSRSDARTYIVDSENSQFKPTDYAQIQGIETNVDGNAKWWLRSPTPTVSYYACLVTDTGGLGETNVMNTCVGVVPAIRIAL